jgi:hypothetical protein
MPRFILMVLVGSLLVASGASAQQPDQSRGDTVSGMMPAPHMTDRATMMKMMASSEARLDQLVRGMNQATGPRKVQAMAAVINELVAQRKLMRAHMRGMMDRGEGSPHGPSE